MAALTALDKIYMVYAVVLVCIWLVLLLWGIIKDPSIKSRVLRLLAVFIILGMSKSKVVNGGYYDMDTFWPFLYQITAGFPVWFIIALSALLVVVIFGYIDIYKENRAST